MYRVLAQSRIAVNRHGDFASGFMRSTCGCSGGRGEALLMTESATNLPDWFEPGQEGRRLRRVDDLVEKIRRFLERGEERRRIPPRGQRRTLIERTCGHRMKQLTRMLKARLR